MLINMLLSQPNVVYTLYYDIFLANLYKYLHGLTHIATEMLSLVNHMFILKLNGTWNEYDVLIMLPIYTVW